MDWRRALSRAASDREVDEVGTVLRMRSGVPFLAPDHQLEAWTRLQLRMREERNIGTVLREGGAIPPPPPDHLRRSWVRLQHRLRDGDADGARISPERSGFRTTRWRAGRVRSHSAVLSWTARPIAAGVMIGVFGLSGALVAEASGFADAVRASIGIQRASIAQHPPPPISSPTETQIAPPSPPPAETPRSVAPVPEPPQNVFIDQDTGLETASEPAGEDVPIPDVSVPATPAPVTPPAPLPHAPAGTIDEDTPASPSAPPVDVPAPPPQPPEPPDSADNEDAGETGSADAAEPEEETAPSQASDADEHPPEGAPGQSGNVPGQGNAAGRPSGDGPAGRGDTPPGQGNVPTEASDGGAPRRSDTTPREAAKQGGTVEHNQGPIPGLADEVDPGLGEGTTSVADEAKDAVAATARAPEPGQRKR